MSVGLEDELDDILQKARDGKSWSPQDLNRSITQPLFYIQIIRPCYPGHGLATTVGEEKQHNLFFCGKH